MKKATAILTIALMSMLSINNWVNAQESPETALFDNIILSAHANDIYFFKSITDQLSVEHKRVGKELINDLTDLKSPNLNQCVAAYYLGEMRYEDSISVLADHITLRVDRLAIRMKGLVSLQKLETPALDALIKIGTPSIPTLVRRLQECDDAKVRELSLNALCQIEGDNEIVQLRLQKALKAQKDSQKQARIQLALKSLAEASLGK
jgi:hypothetical protein